MSVFLITADMAETLFSPKGDPMGNVRQRMQKHVDFLPEDVASAVAALSESVPSDARFVQLERPGGMESVINKRTRCIKGAWNHPAYRLDVLYE